MTRSGLSIFLWAALGMAAGHLAVSAAGRLIPSAFAAGGDVVAARAFELVNEQGRRTVLMAMAREGSPALWFFDANGKARLNFCLYEDGNAGIVLNDEDERAVQIFRTVGPKSAPVLVMKSQGRDRLVMGVNATSQEPFLVTWDSEGKKTAAFGSDQ